MAQLLGVNPSSPQTLASQSSLLLKPATVATTSSNNSRAAVTAPASPAAATNTVVASSPTTTNSVNAAAQAAAQAAAAQSATRAYLADQVNSTLAGENQSGSVAGSTYQNQGNSLVEQLEQGQSAIDSARKNAAVTQINSINALANSIRNGLQGSRVSLGNSNALDSSAANAVGRIYTQYGNTQRNAINNTAAVSNDAQDTAQTNLNLQRSLGLNGLDTYKQTVIDQIANDTEAKLAAIDGIGQLQGVKGAVDIDGLKAQVVQNAQNKIAQADQYIQGQLNNVNPMNADQVASAAQALVNAGTTSSTDGGTTIDTGTPTPQQQVGAPVAASLPLYLKPKTTAS